MPRWASTRRSHQSQGGHAMKPETFLAALVCLAATFILFVYVMPTAIDRELAYTEAGLEQSLSKAQRLEIMEAHK